MEKQGNDFIKKVGFSNYVEEEEIHQLAAFYKLCNTEPELDDFSSKLSICQFCNFEYCHAIEKLSSGEWVYYFVPEKRYISEYNDIYYVAGSVVDLCKDIIMENYKFPQGKKEEYLNKYEIYLASSDLEEEENTIILCMMFHYDPNYISDLLFYIKKDLGLTKEEDIKREKRIKLRMHHKLFSTFYRYIYEIKETILKKIIPNYEQELEKAKEGKVPYIFNYDLSDYADEVMEETMKVVEQIYNEMDNHPEEKPKKYEKSDIYG